MNTPKIIVTAILDTKSDSVKKLEVRSEIENVVTNKSQASAILMEGHPSFAPTTSKRVAYPSISTASIEKFNISVGTEMNEAFNKFGLKARLQVIERAEHFYKDQKPKINPSNDKVLTKDGKPFYRSTELDIKSIDLPFDSDVLIVHDVVATVDNAVETVKEVLSA